ncbi:RAMP superfamily CRISPR-associated protein [Thermodesulfovibrio sp. 3907-1M]|uniref:RAMP superfamily CRISPR-associated protein n=1 Tax=Thermodesulfovibrio autotrophicus TaxID=3118333 RepID=A0AAU8H0G1_9BACT
MKQLKLKIELKSACLVGSAEGFGAVIDSDVVFDEIGIPYVPSKRIKGCLRDSATEVCEMLSSAGIKIFDLTKNSSEYLIVNQLFGSPGCEKPSPLFISNLTVKDYDELRQWLSYCMEEYQNIVNPEGIRKYYTEIRQQTSIEKGVAKEGSLRTCRVLKKGTVFEGTVLLKENTDSFLMLLSFACLNLTRLGTRRNRGFGEIRCSLLEGEKELDFIKQMEG